MTNFQILSRLPNHFHIPTWQRWKISKNFNTKTKLRIMKRKRHQHPLAAACIAMLAFTTAVQATDYTWTGGTSSDWMVSGNWSGGNIGPTDGTYAHRLLVQNGASGATLNYTATQGDTVYTGSRGVVVYSGSSMTITGGSFTGNGTAFDIIGVNPTTKTSAATSITIDGGTFNSNYLAVGFYDHGNVGGTQANPTTRGNNIFNVNSGAAVIGTLDMVYGDNDPNNSRSNGTTNLNGGTLSVNNIFAYAGAGISTVNLNGGTLRARQDNATFISTDLDNLLVGDGGAKIDTNGFNITIGKAMTADGTGGLTKSGGGILTISGANTYTGGTIINQGTLTVGTGGTLGATTGALAVNNTNTDAGTNAVLNLATAVDTTVGSLSGTIATPTSGTNTATINTATGQTFTINQTADATYAGVIAGAGSVTLGSSSTHTLTLSGTNTYTGDTLVSAGTLFVSGSLGNSSVTVGANGTVGGSGTLGGLLHLDSGAGLVFNAGQTLTVNGATVSFGNFGVADLFGLDNTVAYNTYTLIDGTATIDWTNIRNVGIEDAYDLGGGVHAYFQEGSLQLVVAAIPEPAAALLGSLGMLVLLRRRRA